MHGSATCAPLEARPTEAPKLPAGQLQSYSEVAMKKYEENRRNMDHHNAVPSTVYATTTEANFPAVEMESVRESHHS